ncbi:OLC1v1006966C2 [Oldenlandia corymbosa var. corymbosa]|uniref:OLC1v1006966C2 n=1 Tax=Oldenlandia corymbosa var. corymbosa TaxID=529605 RepID=A0AAV1DLA3_OLDCO|nr:OLC1v1006966C2 [Oldenlandia corymbosa var. corymbosa]
MEGGGGGSSGKREEEAGPSSASGVAGRERKKLSDLMNCEDEDDDVRFAVGSDSDDDDDAAQQLHSDHDDETSSSFVPGPLLSLKDQIEKDQEDESLRRWKEKLLGCVESDLNGQMEPEVKFHSIGIISSDFREINTPLPVAEDPNKPVLFTLKEGSEFRLKLKFSVLHNIVSGLAYTNTVWKGGVQVDRSKGMLGTFAPQREPYTHLLEEETTPSGALARGKYSAKLRVGTVRFDEF